MRIVIQRVWEAKVKVEEEVVGSMGQGLLVFLVMEKSYLKLFSIDSFKLVIFVQDITGTKPL